MLIFEFLLFLPLVVGFFAQIFIFAKYRDNKTALVFNTLFLVFYGYVWLDSDWHMEWMGFPNFRIVWVK
ncbi:MAG: hypothetical protein DWQ19_09175 [Crenarchaeota archaeon]|mgnify:CR=1 FL=1|nr:MAG: hypothetical protein DWQ19_09175 [Thermoproteota archaeon]